MAACFSPVDLTGAGGNLTVRVPGGRSVNAETLSYRFAFSGPGGETLSRTLEPPATTLNLVVNPGLWTISADAYTPTGVLYGSGSTSVTVEPGKPAAATVAMRRLPSASPLLTSVAAIDGWIAEARAIDPDAGTAGNPPIPLRMALTLDAAGGNGWADLLDTIADNGVFVALDLSACARGGHSTGGGLYSTGLPGVFDPSPGDTDTNRIAAKGMIVSLVLPDAAEGIAAGDYTFDTQAFRYFAALTSVSGAGIETVGNSAFYGCTVLSTVRFPAANLIGDEAFRGCTGLTMVNLPAAEDIGDYAFYACTALTTVRLDAATDIAQYAFSDCTALTTLSLPAADLIGDYAFYACEALTTVNLNAATSIGVQAFSYCSSLETVNLPAAEDIGNYAFYECDALATVSLNAATSIGGQAFSYCSSLATVSLNAATSIGGSAFSGCTALATVSLPAATSIGVTAFSDCTSLATVSLNAATSIGGSAFSYTGSTALTVTLGSTAPVLEVAIFYGVTAAKAVTVRVPSGAAAWTGKTGSFTTDTTTGHWGNAFRGKGWNGTSYLSGAVNSSINLTVTDTP